MKIGKIEEDIKDRVNVELLEIRQDLKLKTYNEETIRVWKHFSKYAEYTDLRDLYSKVLPQISKFEDKLLDLSREQAKVTEIIRRFDEIMSDKASKQNIRELTDKFDYYVRRESLIDYKAENNLKFHNCTLKQEQLEQNLDILG